MKKNPFEKFLGPEDHVCHQLCKYVELQYPNAVFFHIPNESRKTPFERYKAVTLGMLAGVSDYCLISPDGRIMFLEVKADKGRLSENQKEFIGKLNNLGVRADYAKGFENCKDLIDDFLTQGV